jgi:hypothetical protein
MTISTPRLPLTVQVRDRASLESQLDAAVSCVQEVAGRERRRGILVTRRGYGDFIVDLSDAVPFGVTRERQDW